MSSVWIYTLDLNDGDYFYWECPPAESNMLNLWDGILGTVVEANQDYCLAIY